jgi:dimethylglycine dehydrogenase
MRSTSKGEIYMRQEGKGMLIGTYEKRGVPWSERDTPWNFVHELLPPDLERHCAVARGWLPALSDRSNGGHQADRQRAVTFAPDGNPLIGPIRGLSNFWVACGVMAGFSQGGGVRPRDVELDDRRRSGLRRLGDGQSAASATGRRWRTRTRRSAKIIAALRIRFPNEGASGRASLRTTPAYDRLKAKGAVFGVATDSNIRCGTRPPAWNPSRTSPIAARMRTTWSAPNAARCAAASGCSRPRRSRRYSVTGPDAEGWAVARAREQAAAPGRMALSPMLNERGKLIGDFTVANAGNRSLFRFGSGIAETYHLRWFRKIKRVRLIDPVAAHRAARFRDRRSEFARAALACVPARRVERSVSVSIVPRDDDRHDPREDRPDFVHRRARL